jgi:hypothetical protein
VTGEAAAGPALEQQQQQQQQQQQWGLVAFPSGEFLPLTAANYPVHAHLHSPTSLTSASSGAAGAFTVRSPTRALLPPPEPANAASTTVADTVHDLWSVFLALLDLCQRPSIKPTGSSSSSYVASAAAAAAGADGVAPVVMKGTRQLARYRAAADHLQRLRARFLRLQQRSGDALAARLDALQGQISSIAGKRQRLDSHDVELQDELYVVAQNTNLKNSLFF